MNTVLAYICIFGIIILASTGLMKLMFSANDSMLIRRGAEAHNALARREAQHHQEVQTRLQQIMTTIDAAPSSWSLKETSQVQPYHSPADYTSVEPLVQSMQEFTVKVTELLTQQQMPDGTQNIEPYLARIASALEVANQLETHRQVVQAQHVVEPHKTVESEAANFTPQAKAISRHKGGKQNKKFSPTREQILHFFEEIEEKSLRKAGDHFGYSHTTIKNILEKDE